MRHTFISAGLSNGVNIKWLADYCGTSVAMIEKHYGKYIKNDSDEQLGRLWGANTVTFAVTQQKKAAGNISKGLIFQRKKLVGPPGFEPARSQKKNGSK